MIKFLSPVAGASRYLPEESLDLMKKCLEIADRMDDRGVKVEVGKST
jgi:hypothetical protein